MFISAATIHMVYDLMQKDYLYEEVLRKFFPRKEVREEFYQELILYLFEHGDHIVDVWNKKYFRYYFINILQNQVKSNDSNWHNNFRKPLYQLTDNLPEETEEPNHFQQEEIEYEIKKKNFKIELVNKALNHYMSLDPTFKPDADMFRMYYFEGMNMRQIADKMFNTPLTTVFKSIQSTEHMVKWYIKKHHRTNIN